jgi:[protein-PII] uridylyltransferase
MAETLASRLRRAEAALRRSYLGPESEWPERRRRLRLDLLREHLLAGYDRLKTRHADGASGAESVRTHTAFMDDLLRWLYRTADGEVRAAGHARTPLVLVALGGYGREELHPSSDLDLMLIHGGELTPYVQRMAQEILYTLWDVGLRVGHACRSLGDCLALARTDLPSRTSMQAARVLAGDQALFRALHRTLRREVFRRDYPEFLAQMLAERDERYRKHGGSVYVQEPNVKESAGGLRDVHTALWLASARFGARSLQELADKGLLSPKEQAATDSALTFLWRVRNELHFLAGTKQDVLERGLQAAVAKSLGYQDDEVRLGVETFMRDYYRHARAVHRVSARLIARCQEGLARHGTVGRRGRRAALADGLVVYAGRLHLAEPGALRADPARILRVFWHAQQLGCELDVELERALEEAAPLIAEEAWRASPELRRVFLAILRSWGRVATTLRRMHDTGVLGAYLPEFGALDCLVQYDHYHRYSVDQHSLLAVEVLEGLGPSQGAATEELAQIVAELERPELLMLGMLLHDIGKALGHGHVAKGVPLIRAVTRRINLDPDDAAAVEFLVEHHLLLSHMAERRDLDDPKTIEHLATVVRFPAWLTMLYVLTCADIRAVGPGVWNAWRGALLRELYLRTRTRLAGRAPKPPRRAAVVQRIVQVLADPSYGEPAERHLQAMSDRYVRTTSPQRMAAHLRLIDRLREEPVATEVFHFPDLGASDFVVVTRDTPGLFAVIAGTLAAHGVNILSAQIETRGDGLAVDTFHVNEAGGDAILDESRWEAVLRDLRRALGGECSVETLLAQRRPPRAGLVRPSSPGPARVTVDNSLSDTHTVVEVKAPDRLGLLYLITRALAAEGLDIATAKIATDLDHALDAFYVVDRTGSKVEAPAATAQLRAAILDALGGDPGAPPHAGTL